MPEEFNPRACWLEDYAARLVEAGHAADEAEDLARDAWHALPWRDRAQLLGACDPVRPFYRAIRPPRN